MTNVRLYLVIFMVCSGSLVHSSHANILDSGDTVGALESTVLDVVDVNESFSKALKGFQRQFDREQRKPHADLVMQAASNAAVSGQVATAWKQIGKESAQRELAMREAFVAMLKLQKALNAIPKSARTQDDNATQARMSQHWEILQQRFA